MHQKQHTRSTKPNDPVVRLVESFEAQAIDQLNLSGVTIQERGSLRISLLDALTQAKRAERMSQLMSRLHNLEGFA